MQKYISLSVLALSIVGCSTVVSVAPGSENVRIVKPYEKQTVTNCKVVGPASVAVSSNELNMSAIAQDNTQILKNYTFAVGGDTFFPTFGTRKAKGNVSQVHGVVYNCTGIDTRQPVPTQSK
jgi:hypothetical protein